VVCGVDQSLNMCPEDLQRCISPKTKAIIPVHMLGVPADMDAIGSIAASNSIPVIEDACEAVGARYNDKPVGTLGHLGVFSFDFGKNITTGEGGCVLTNDEELFNNSRAIHDHGHSYAKPKDRGNDPCVSQGFNFRMTEISGAIGCVQLSKLDFILDENKKRYDQLIPLGQLAGLKLRMIPQHATPSYDTFIIKTNDPHLREAIIEHLNNSGIGTKNLPGATIWHCSVNWSHLIQLKHNLAAETTHEYINSHIAIPISLLRSVNFYRDLTGSIIKICGENV
jgi:8-amino-3,8-dideoxy-alpha-D-manno-octulosonate transaminase